MDAGIGRLEELWDGLAPRHRPGRTVVVYVSHYRVWARYRVVMDPTDVPVWEFVLCSLTTVPWVGEVHLSVRGFRDLHGPVTEAQATELTGLVGPPALDRLREIVEA